MFSAVQNQAENPSDYKALRRSYDRCRVGHMALDGGAAIVEQVTGANGLAVVVRHIDLPRVRWSALGAVGVHELDLPTRGAARRAAIEIAGGSTSLSPSMLDRGGDR